MQGQFGESNFDFDLEGAYQFGDVGSNDIDAFMVTGEVGYSRPDSLGGTRIFVGGGYASGDRSPGGDLQTFNSLFPHGYAYLGYMAEIGRQNVIDLHTGIAFRPQERLTIELLGHVFWLADTDDAHYSARNTILDVGRSTHFVGSEIDLRLLYQFDRHFSGLIGYSHFFIGSSVEQLRPADDGDLLYVHLQYTF